MAADEELLIEAARKKRQARRSGRTLIITWVIGLALGVAGWAVLFQVRPFIKSIPFLPLGSVLAGLLWIGLAAFALAAILLAGGWFFARPNRPWGKEVAGVCPKCESLSLREDTIEVEKRDPAGFNVGPKGLVTLCTTKRCDYANARVTTASRA